MAISAGAPAFAEELIGTPAEYAMSSTVWTIINGTEYTRETAYDTIRSWYDCNFNPDSSYDLEVMMESAQMDLDILCESYYTWIDSDWSETGLRQVEQCKLCISLLRFLMDTL